MSVSDLLVTGKMKSLKGGYMGLLVSSLDVVRDVIFRLSNRLTLPEYQVLSGVTLDVWSC